MDNRRRNDGESALAVASPPAKISPAFRRRFFCPRNCVPRPLAPVPGSSLPPPPPPFALPTHRLPRKLKKKEKMQLQLNFGHDSRHVLLSNQLEEMTRKSALKKSRPFIFH